MTPPSTLSSKVIATDYEGWTPELRQEFADNAHNTNVGTRLLSQTSTIKVWHIRVAPGERVPAHRHDKDYFWTALRAGRSRQHSEDGTTREATYAEGDTKHYEFPGDDYMIHDLENTGDTELEFITVEHL
ncbi:cupin domain-containing protein [Pseudarthrobacter sp. NPDC092184]|uniref:cupin domain-containing protein n=1 Tax=unclassified Pseudarthrobacter TaxID=2647000 RepID=UPI00380C9A9C